MSGNHPNLRTLAPDDPRHGTANAYGNLGCRCDRCRGANAAGVRAQRERRKAGIPPARRPLNEPEQLAGERWAPVLGYEGAYEVSDFGRVRSLDRVGVQWRGAEFVRQGRLLRQTSMPRTKHRTVRLSRNGVAITPFVHVLVLEAFVGPRPLGMECCHNDGNSENNLLSNLRWDTPSANRLDAVRHGTHPQAGKTHCKNGHEFTSENTHYRNGGRHRQCKACRSNHVARRKAQPMYKIPPDGEGDLARPSNPLYEALVFEFEISQWNGMPGGLW